MTHLRKTIRDELVTAVTGLSTTGSNVFDSRVMPLSQASLPALCVYAASEESEQVGNTLLRRYVNLAVVAFVRAVAGIEDTLDTIAEEVETAVVLSAFTDVKRITLGSTEFDFSDEGDTSFASMTLTFVAEYHTVQGTPGVSN